MLDKDKEHMNKFILKFRLLFYQNSSIM